MCRGVDGLDSDHTAFVAKKNVDGKTSNVFRSTDLFASGHLDNVMTDVIDFEVIDDYMFTVTNTTTVW